MTASTTIFDSSRSGFELFRQMTFVNSVWRVVQLVARPLLAQNCL